MKKISLTNNWSKAAILIIVTLIYFTVLRRFAAPGFAAQIEGIILAGMGLFIIGTPLTVLIGLAARVFKKKHSTEINNLGGRMTLLVVLIVFLAVFVFASQWTAYTPQITDNNGAEVQGSIASVEKVRLGNTEQWLIIRGEDVNKPVLLFLSGGPGGSEAARVLRFNKALEKDFVVVIWEQRGCGKSFPSFRPVSDLTMEQYTSDIVALSEMLRKRFDEEKIYLLGHSWGTIIGVRAVQERPDLFHAYIGSAQMVDVRETDQLIYQMVLEHSRKSGDGQFVKKLEAQGEPPYTGKSPIQQYAPLFAREYSIFEVPNIQNEAYRREGDILMLMLKQPEYGWMDRFYYLLGLVKTFNIVYPQLQDIDLRVDAARLDVPVYLILGRHDMNNPYHIPEAYFNILQAPQKQLVYFEKSGHGMIWEEADLYHSLLTEKIVPETYY